MTEVFVHIEFIDGPDHQRFINFDVYDTMRAAQEALMQGTSSKTWEALEKSHNVEYVNSGPHWKEELIDVMTVSSKTYTRERYYQEIYHLQVKTKP